MLNQAYYDKTDEIIASHGLTQAALILSLIHISLE